jgi:hypothetical protein
MPPLIRFLVSKEILAHAKGGPHSRVCARKNHVFTPKYIIVGVEWGGVQNFV